MLFVISPGPIGVAHLVPLALTIVRTFAESQDWAVDVDRSAVGARFLVTGVEHTV